MCILNSRIEKHTYICFLIAYSKPFATLDSIYINTQDTIPTPYITNKRPISDLGTRTKM